MKHACNRCGVIGTSKTIRKSSSGQRFCRDTLACSRRVETGEAAYRALIKTITIEGTVIESMSSFDREAADLLGAA